MKLIIITFTIVLIATSQCVFGSKSVRTKIEKLVIADDVSTETEYVVHESLVDALATAIQKIIYDAKKKVRKEGLNASNDEINFAKAKSANLIKKMNVIIAHVPQVNPFLHLIRKYSEKLDLHKNPLEYISKIKDNAQFIIESRTNFKTLNREGFATLVKKGEQLVSDLKTIDKIQASIESSLNKSFGTLVKACTNFIQKGIGALRPKPASTCATEIIEVSKIFIKTFNDNTVGCVNTVKNDFETSINATYQPRNDLIDVIITGDISVYLVRKILKPIPRLEECFTKINYFTPCAFTAAVKSLFVLEPLVKTSGSKCMIKL